MILLSTINRYLSWFGLLLLVVGVGDDEPTRFYLWTRRRWLDAVRAKEQRDTKG